MTEFAEGLRRLLDEHKLTVYRLAERSGVADQTIHAILGGQSKAPGLPVLKKLAKGFGIKTWQLIRKTVKD